MTTSTMVLVLGTAAITIVPVSGLVRALAAREASPRARKLSVIGCGLVIAAEAAYVGWLVVHYLDLRDGWVDLDSPGLRVLTQAVVLLLLAGGIAALVEAAVSRRESSASHMVDASHAQE